MSEFEYDVALSFAGEDREIVEKIAHLLESNDIRVFYDNFKKAKLWGEDLYELLAKLYSKQARFCLMFISSHYVEKLWTNHERQNAQERAFQERGAYILPVKLDNTEVPGLRKTIGYLDLRKETPEQLVELIKEKLGKSNELHLPQWFSHDKYWVGREELVAKLSAKIRNDYRVLLILGLTGIGKTALAEKLALDLKLKDWLKGDWNSQFRRANFDYFDKPIDFVTVAIRWLEEWGEKLTPEESKPERLLSRLVKRLRDNQILVLIDSLERLLTGGEEKGWGDFADEWWEKFFLQILSAEFCKSRIIVTSQDLPTKLDSTRYQNFLCREILGGLSENEQEALFKITGFDVDKDKAILFRLGNAYKGHPLVLRVILGEIKEDFQKNVQAYWENISSKIEEVERAIMEAENDATKIMGSQDDWKLHKLTRRVRGQVNRERLESVFERLSTQVEDAYLLICAASVYRLKVQEEGWTMQLAALVERLEKQECSWERQQKALEELDKRFLVEKSCNHNDKPMLGQHNLVRSVALERNKQLIQRLKEKVKSV